MDRERNTMSLPREKKRTLDLEKGLLLTKEDFAAMGTPRSHKLEDLESYLDFLDELWGSGRKEISKRFYSKQFQL